MFAHHKKHYSKNKKKCKTKEEMKELSKRYVGIKLDSGSRAKKEWKKLKKMVGSRQARKLRREARQQWKDGH